MMPFAPDSSALVDDAIGDPVTWLQALGGVGLVGLLIGLLVWLLRLISNSGKEVRQENEQLRKEIKELKSADGRDRQVQELRAALDAERALRFAAEDARHAADLIIKNLPKSDEEDEPARPGTGDRSATPRGSNPPRELEAGRNHLGLAVPELGGPVAPDGGNAAANGMSRDGDRAIGDSAAPPPSTGSTDRGNGSSDSGVTR